MEENSKNFEACYSISYKNHIQIINWLSAFSNAESRFPIGAVITVTYGWHCLSEQYQTVKSRDNFRKLVRLPVKSPELASVFIEASRNLKKYFLNNIDAKILKPSALLQKVLI
jgi:hypothetical protein